MEPVALTPLAPIANKESLIERFGDWFEGLFHHAETIYESLTDEEKKAGVWASGVIALVNANLDAVPSVIVTLIQQKFPDISIDVIHGFLDDVRNKVDNLNSEIPLTLEDAIAWAQKYLAQHVGDHSTWAIVTTGVVNLLATLFSPGTAVEKFISAGVYIYHLIVKPHVEGTAVPAPTPAPDPTPAPALPPPATDESAPSPATGTTATANTPDKNLPADVPPSDDNSPEEDAAASVEEPDPATPAPDQPEGTPVPADPAPVDNAPSIPDAPASPASDVPAADPAAPVVDEDAVVNPGVPVDPTADPSHDPIEEAMLANRPATAFEQANAGATPVPVPEPVADQPAQDAPAPEAETPITSTNPADHEEAAVETVIQDTDLKPGSPEFETAVETEVERRLAALKNTPGA